MPRRPMAPTSRADAQHCAATADGALRMRLRLSAVLEPFPPAGSCPAVPHRCPPWWGAKPQLPPHSPAWGAAGFGEHEGGSRAAAG